MLYGCSSGQSVSQPSSSGGTHLVRNQRKVENVIVTQKSHRKVCDIGKYLNFSFLFGYGLVRPGQPFFVGVHLFKYVFLYFYVDFTKLPLNMISTLSPKNSPKK